MKQKKSQKEIKKAIRCIIRNHKSFQSASKCKFCKDRLELIKEFAWDF